jgi:hypothetical protein
LLVIQKPYHYPILPDILEGMTFTGERLAFNFTGASKITYQDIKNIEALAAEPDVLDQLAASLAPSIYGHKVIKKGLLMLLLGGEAPCVFSAHLPLMIALPQPSASSK